MKKVNFTYLFLILFCKLYAQVPDFNLTYKTAMEMFNNGNYNGAKVRFTIAQRKAEHENNYYGKEQCHDYIDKSDECYQDIRNGERTFNLGEFEIAKKYFDRVAELNPKDPSNIERAGKCRNETDYLNAKKQADAFYLNKDWNQAYALYNVCLDSSKKVLSSYKRYYNEVYQKDQDCLKQMNILNPDSIKVRLKATKDKLIKKFGKKGEKTPEEQKKEEDKKQAEKDKKEACLPSPQRNGFCFNQTRRDYYWPVLKFTSLKFISGNIT